MLNNFCFHVYAQKSLFIGENDNALFLLGVLTGSAWSLQERSLGKGDEHV